MKHNCSDSCKKCEGCGACLYVVGFKQVPDPEYPFFRCESCGWENFWD